MKQRVLCVLAPGAAHLNALAEACFRFTPQIAIREGEAVFLEIGASAVFFKEATLLLRIQALSKRFGITPRIAIADNVYLALILARLAQPGHPQTSPIPDDKMPVEVLGDYASPFISDEHTTTKIHKLVSSLRKLGVTRLGDFRKLPPKTLASRFGMESVMLATRLRDGFSPPWPRFVPPEKIIEKEDLTDPETMSSCNLLEPLFFTLKSVVDRAMARLRARYERAAVIELHLAARKGPGRKWTITLPLPQGSATGLIPILRERLGFDLDRAPLTEDIQEIHFTLLETAPGHGAQRDFFNSREDEAEAWDSLIGRIGAKLGKSGAFVALPVDRYLPEKAWVPTLQSALAGTRTYVTPDRPARLLKKPERVIIDGSELIQKGDEANRQKIWRIAERYGPERLSGEWWNDPHFAGFHRDYYRIVTEGGEQLWIFETPKPGHSGFYLHGYFD